MPAAARMCCSRQPIAAQVNPALYCAFRRPGGVEYEDKDKQAKPLMYGNKADDENPETSMREGERCPGFPFNPHREYERALAPHRLLAEAPARDASRQCLLMPPQGRQQSEQLE